MWNGRSPMPSAGVPLLPYEPCDISVQKPVPFSAPPVLPDVSYSSGRLRSCANSCENTPTPPFSGSIV
jgi:hypothetical protein